MDSVIMKQRYESLPLKELRALAKQRQMDGTSSLRKSDLIERMLEEDEKDAAKKRQEIADRTAVSSSSDESGHPEETATVRKRRSEPAAEGGRRSADRAAAVKKNNRGSRATGRTRVVKSEEELTEASAVSESEPESASAENTSERSGEADMRENAVRESALSDIADNTEKPAGRRNRTAGKNSSAGRGSAAASGDRKEEADSRPVRKRRTVQTKKNVRVQEESEQDALQQDHAQSRNASERSAALQNTAEKYSGVRRKGQEGQPSESAKQVREGRTRNPLNIKPEIRELDTGESVRGVLEIMSEGYGFLRSDNFLPGEDDVYVSPSQIRRFRLRTGDMVTGNVRTNSGNEKYNALLYVTSVNDDDPEKAISRPAFETLIPIFPDERIRLEIPGGSTAMRIVDLVSPIGKGQRGLIVSPPKAGKTTLLKQMAQSVLANNPEMHVMILLIDERPEEVTDMIDTVTGMNVEVLFSTFDELPEHHKKVAEMTIERAKRMVEAGKDVIIFTDSITRLARANNQVVPPSGRTLSGGLDPAALHMPKKFFGAARNIRGGGSLTILATALVDTGSKMDDVVYEEFKGTGNMELFLDRKLQERRVFPAIDLQKSGTRREDLLLTPEEQEAVTNMRRALVGMRSEEAGENILNMFAHTKSNRELVMMLRKSRII